MSWVEFYADPDLADGFDSTAGDRANPHRGLDFSHAGGTSIPSYVAGTVVINEWSKALGWILEVRTPLGRYVGYRHMKERSPFSVGDAVKLAQGIGFVGNTGSASRGNHLCTTNASGQGGVHGYPALVSDPWPYIQAAIGSSTPAGGNLTPTTPAAPTSQRRDTMARPIRQGTPGQTYYNGWALVGETTFELNPANEALANEWGRIWNGKSGQYDVVTATEFHNALAGVNRRRAQNGLPALPLPK
ncbi:peptidase M23-like protein [Microterricola gilva]|uniref:Peptidase M23-like protein n=1 Tax=Microterricola gilva TaxID=393267 RepID=A0A4Q8AJE4_9MICO|nr:M23 family metallopeptidase [Microterricola gilva]RZU64612.1 peptidase M23-like protein [Microterricola gilva]